MRINTIISDDDADLILDLMPASGIAAYIRNARTGAVPACDYALNDDGSYLLSMLGVRLGTARKYPSNDMWHVRVLGDSKQITARSPGKLTEKVYEFVMTDSVTHASIRETLLSTARQNANPLLSGVQTDLDELL